MESSADTEPVVRYQVDDLTIDTERHIVHRDGVELSLPPRSYERLVALIRAHPRMLSIDDLLTKVWAPAVVNPETVGTRAKLLRKALGDDPRNPRYLISVRGRGYRLAAPGDPVGRTRTTDVRAGSSSSGSAAAGRLRDESASIESAPPRSHFPVAL